MQQLIPGFSGKVMLPGSFLIAAISFFCAGAGMRAAAPTGASTVPQPGQTPADNAAPAVGSLYIREFRVDGAHQLGRLEIEEAVYPFMGPGRTAEDVEKARAALEKAFRDKGFQTVSVQIPPQNARGGVVVLKVEEAVVGRLRVKGARYFSPEEIRRGAPSMAEGRVMNFNGVTRDIIGLNQNADRQVTPELRPGRVPGTVDIDLNVKDSLPLHGSVELNNRNSADTTSLRLNGSVSYSNLWQLGHTAGFSFQLAPQRLEDAMVFSAYYLARLPGVDWLSLMVQGTKQDSNVSTLGGAADAGRGQVVGIRLLFTLPAGKDFYQTLSLGMDYKHFDQDFTVGSSDLQSPITYYPLSAAYGATWTGKGSLTELNGSLNLAFRGMGSSQSEFNNRRTGAGGDYIYLRGDLAHTHDLPGGFQVYGKVQGQVSDQPLVDSEQFTGGGLETSRGYYESEVTGDNAFFGTLELRSPSLGGWLGKRVNDWRFYIFGDRGILTVRNALPEQQSFFDLASAGVGSRFRLMDHLNGSIDAGFPLISQGQTKAGNLRLIFRVWADF